MTKLPEPAHCGPSGTGDYFSSYSKEQMLQFRRDALEEAARQCDEFSIAEECATAIHKLKDET
jgi:hypothetical protein